MTKQQFIAAATATAQACSQVSGFPAGVTVAQAALESRWGRSRLSREAHNYFGIKARRARPSVQFETLESVNGSMVRTLVRFAKYDSINDCFADRDRIIATLPYYAAARACCDDPVRFIRALAKSWATDPDYADKLLKLYRAHNLDSLDHNPPSATR